MIYETLVKNEILREKGSIREIEYEGYDYDMKVTFDIADAIINPEDCSIDWNGFLMFCDIYEVEDRMKQIELIKTMRNLNARRYKMKEEFEEEMKEQSAVVNNFVQENLIRVRAEQLKLKEEREK